MKKEYVTARLFRNRRAADGLNTNELHDSDQQQSTEAQDNSQGNNKTSESEDQNESTLPQGLLNILQRALEVLAPNRKD